MKTSLRLVAAFIVAVSTFACTASDGTVAGRARAEFKIVNALTQEPVEGVTATIEDANVATSDGAGSVLLRLKPGAYSVKLSHEGFDDATFDIKVPGNVPAEAALTPSAPVLTSATPAEVFGGAALTLKGGNFQSKQLKSSQVTVGGVAAEATSWKDETIVVTVPAGTTPGVQDVVIAVGAKKSKPTKVTVRPTLTSAAPTVVQGGNNVTLTGSNFGTAAGSVSLDGTVVTPSAWSNTSIVFVAPASIKAGHYSVSVAVADVESATVSLSIAPSADTFAPAATSSTAVITLGGRNLGAVQGNSLLSVAGIPMTPTAWAMQAVDFQLTPAIPPGPQSVVLTVGGIAAAAKMFTVLPHLAAVSDLAVVGNEALTLTGANFGATASLVYGEFGATQVQVSSVSPTSAQVTVPPTLAPGAYSFRVAAAGYNSGATTMTIYPNVVSTSAVTGSAGDTLYIAGTNLGDSGSVTLGGLAATVQLWTPGFVRVTVPDGAVGSAPIVVTANALDSAPFAFDLRPRIDGQSVATATSGDEVTITGVNFGAAAGTITLGGVSAGLTGAGWGANSIQFGVPDSVTAGTRAIVVNAGGFASAGASITITPTLSAANPVTGIAGATVTLAGTNFGTLSADGVIAVGGIPVVPAAWNATQATFAVPATLAAGAQTIQLTVNGETSGTVAFTVHPLISSLSATSGIAGDSITLNGANFGASTAAVLFDGVPVTVTSWSNAQIVVSVPAGLSTGQVGIVVRVNATNSAAAAFELLPSIGVVTSAPLTGGDLLTIPGSNFPPAGSVTLGGVAATVSSGWYSSVVTVTVPNDVPAGSRDVVVSAGAFSSAPAAVRIVPTLVGLDATDTRMGDTLTVTGTNFDDGNGTISATIGGLPVAGTATLTSDALTFDETITAGTRNVQIVANGEISNALAVNVHPMLTGAMPGSGVSGTTVDLTGGGFGDSAAGNSVTLSGYAASINSWSAGAINFTVPNDVTAGTQNLVVTVSGQDSYAAPFTITPTLISMSINSGTGGNAITLNGANFGTQNGAVNFGGFNGTIVSWSTTQIQAEVSREVTAGTRQVVVIAGGKVTNSMSFDVAASITSISQPTIGYGEQVVAYGSNFGYAHAASFLLMGSDNVPIVAWSPTAITFTAHHDHSPQAGYSLYTNIGFQYSNFFSAPRVIPSITSVTPTTVAIGDSIAIHGHLFGTYTGTIKISDNDVVETAWSPDAVTVVVNGVGAGPHRVQVEYYFNGYKLSNAVWITVVPKITGLSVASGGAGDLVTLNGAGFSDVAGSNRVLIGGVPATVISWANAAVTVLVPSGLTVGANDVVIEIAGIASAPVAFTVLPKIAQIAPSSGPSGSTIVLTGSSFGASGTVTIGGATALTGAWSDGAIEVTVPGSLLDGLQDVVVSVGGYDSAPEAFEVNPVAAPTGLTAVQSDIFKVSLAWTDNSAIEDGFFVERGVNGGGYVVMATLPTDTATFADTTVTDATTYSYRVFAYQAAVTSGRSNSADVSLPLVAMGVDVNADHACMITSDGRVKCWGYGANGRLGTGNGNSASTPVYTTVITGGTTSVAAGLNHSCAIVRGAVYCWGRNDSGQLGQGSVGGDFLDPVTVPAITSGAVQIVAGNNFTCVLLSTGVAKCFGSDSYGSLGNDNFYTPLDGQVRDVALGAEVATKVSAGGGHACVTTVSGRLLCWGEDWEGQLGDNSGFSSRYSPITPIGLSSGVADVGAGRSHTCVIMSAGGTLKCFGEGTNGRLGNGGTTQQKSPVNVIGYTGALSKVDAGGSYACAVSANTQAICWGGVQMGALGGDVPAGDYAAPVSVVAPAGGFLDIAAGEFTVCGRTPKLGLYCWGQNTNNLLGIGDPTYKATRQALGPPVVAMSLDYSSGCKLTVAGALLCWGNNYSYSLSIPMPSTVAYPLPQVSVYTANVVDAAINSNHGCALLSDGSMECWGSNYNGQVGVGNTTSPQPRTTVLASGVAAIGVGVANACAVMTDGGVKCWGANNYGQVSSTQGTNVASPFTVTGLPAAAVSVTPGYMRICALLVTDELYCWGINRPSPTKLGGTPAGINKVVAGSTHFCMSTNAGAMYCWDNNQYGQQGANTFGSATPLLVEGMGSGVTSISAGDHSTCATTSAGEVWCWGDAWYGQAGGGQSGVRLYRASKVLGLTGTFVGVTTGYRSACAWKASGETYCWGENNNYSSAIGIGALPVPVSGF